MGLAKEMESVFFDGCLFWSENKERNQALVNRQGVVSFFALDVVVRSYLELILAVRLKVSE